MNVHLALYATIKSYELSERIRREDLTFDAFEFLSTKIGHKSSSTLRKMREPRSTNNGAKLGFEEACAIIEITGDSRLLDWAIETIRVAKLESERQIYLFVGAIHESPSFSTIPPKINSKPPKGRWGIPPPRGTTNDTPPQKGSEFAFFSQSHCTRSWH